MKREGIAGVVSVIRLLGIGWNAWCHSVVTKCVQKLMAAAGGCAVGHESETR